MDVKTTPMRELSAPTRKQMAGRPLGKALRPHVKTHKCSMIARKQVAAGAVGLCVAKLLEAEALIDH